MLPLLPWALGGAATWWYLRTSAEERAKLSPGNLPPHASPPMGSPFAPSGDSGRAFVQSLGQSATMSRDHAIASSIVSGFLPAIQWEAVTGTRGGHTVKIFCSRDLLQVGIADPIRINVSHLTAQRLADALGCTLGTSRMSDMAWFAASQVAPVTLPADAHMADTARMVEHSDRVGIALAKAGGGFCRDLSKEWVNTERLAPKGGAFAPMSDGSGGTIPGTIASANFGFHIAGASSKSPGGAPVLQSVGLRHGEKYTDYSQCVPLYRMDVEIDGAVRSVEEVLRDPDLAFLLSDEVPEGTACKVFRYPPADAGNA